MPKPLVRITFVAAIVLLIVQYDLYYRVGEPYPAIIMPGFAGGGGSDGLAVEHVRCEAVLYCTDGSQVPVSSNRLLEHILPSHRRFACTVFRSIDEENETRSGLKYRVFPYLDQAQFERSPDSLRAWLADRADEMAPGKQVDSVEFSWYRETLSDDSSTLLDQTTIKLIP
jgi:hypothetical protein